MAGIANRGKVTMLGSGEAEAEVVVAFVRIVPVPVTSRAVVGVVVPTATPVHTVVAIGFSPRTHSNLSIRSAPLSRHDGTALSDGCGGDGTRRPTAQTRRYRVTTELRCLMVAAATGLAALPPGRAAIATRRNYA